jgi:hypothetical protein
MVGETMRMWGERWSHSGAASGNVETCLGRSVAYVRARSVSCADGLQGPRGDERSMLGDLITRTHTDLHCLRALALLFDIAAGKWKVGK